VIESPRRYLVIVGRDKPDVYEELREHFLEGSSVEVIWDRRFGERRRRLVMKRRERRIRERRQRPPETWVSGGYLLVREPSGSRE
jgi:hypothetical protein